LPASTTTLVTVMTGATNGTKVAGLWVTSTDTASNTIFVTIERTGPLDYVQTAVTIPANSGNAAGTPPVNLMSAANWPGLPLDSDGTPYLYLESTDTLRVNVGTTVTAAKIVNVNLVAADFN
jgi:hypothetical protein